MALQGRGATLADAADAGVSLLCCFPRAQGLGMQCLWAVGSGEFLLGPVGVAGQATACPTGLGVHSPRGFRCEYRAFCATEGALPGRAELGAQRPGQLLQENSPNSFQVALFSLFLFEKFLLFKPAAPYKGLASHTAQLSNQTRDSPGQGLS